VLHPTDIYVGSNVFDGCHEDFRIVVAPQLLFEYINDPNWSQYADKIVASDYIPTAYSAITYDGVTYDYASTSLNSLPTSELVRLQSSWWNAAIIAAEVAIAIASYGLSNAATAATVGPAKIAEEKGFGADFRALELIEKLTPEIFASEKHNNKKICANVDLYSGLIYQMLGIPEDLYTPLFAIARIAGWSAHRMEELISANRFIRPAYKNMTVPKEYVPIDERISDYSSPSGYVPLDER
jgi:hypothetical protein